jgi:hypothetical protein
MVAPSEMGVNLLASDGVVIQKRQQVLIGKRRGRGAAD